LKGAYFFILKRVWKISFLKPLGHKCEPILGGGGGFKTGEAPSSLKREFFGVL